MLKTRHEILVRTSIWGKYHSPQVKEKQCSLYRTSSEIESHRKCGSYVEINAVKQCIQILEKTNVVLLSGREACGKSRNGLEILRQLKEANGDSEVFKLYDINFVSTILKCNAISIVLLEFANIDSSYQLSDKLELLSSYTSQNMVKIIFVMRNTVKHKCKHLLSNHKVFRDSIDIDLTSEQFMLTRKEKENILTNYCSINKISIVDLDENVKSKSRILNDDTERDTKDSMHSLSADAPLVLRKDTLSKILQTDPFCGFPECCVLFTDNKNKYFLDDTCFKWPSRDLINDIEKLRMEGKDNYTKALMYVILIYLLSLCKPINEHDFFYHPKGICLLARDITETQPYQELFNACYPMMNNEILIPDIIYGYEELLGHYLVKKDGTYYFQHQALQDSILISYSKINPRVIIPLLGFEHMIDLVRLQNYTERKDEIVIRIFKPYYSDLAKHVTSFLNHCTCYRYRENYWKRMMECKIFTEIDVNLINQFILSSKRDEIRNSNFYCVNLLPLYLLGNIGKLDDKTLTVNHTQHKMLITAVIGDTNITLSVDPTIALICAFLEKYENIIKWVLQNTYHTFINFISIMSYECFRSDFENVKLLLQNVNHDKIDMNMILQQVYSYDEYELNNLQTTYWTIDNVNHSLIDYNKFVDDNIDYIDSCIIDYLLRNINTKWFDISKVVESCFKNCRSDLVEWILQNVDNTSFDNEKIFDAIIEDYWKFHNYEYTIDPVIENFVELLFAATSVKYINIDRFVDWAIEEQCTYLLELFFQYDNENLINTDKVLKCAFQIIKCKIESEDSLFAKDVVVLIMKYYLKSISFDYANTLDILMFEIQHDDNSNIIDYQEDLLVLLLQRIDLKVIDIFSVMSDVCEIGNSKAILWLLENNPSYRFNMRKVMNKACFHGDHKLVEDLFNKYCAEDFDYKTAMIKACRNSKMNTSNVCKWLWKNIEHVVFDMKRAFDSACRCNNSKVVEWMLTDVDTTLYDRETAVFSAIQHSTVDMTQLLLDNSGVKILDFQSALILACQNECFGLEITKLLYKRANKSTVDKNAVFSAACKNYRSDLVRLIIETWDQNITLAETTDGKNTIIENRNSNLLDMNRSITCIIGMNAPDKKKQTINETKKSLLWLVLKRSHPTTIIFYELLTESCKNDWEDIFKWILDRVEHSCLNIGEIINIACQEGAFNIVKWSLKNIEMHLLDANNIMVESCAYGWLQCLISMHKHCNGCDLHKAMIEACTYQRLTIAEWLLQNNDGQCFDLLLLLNETCRNGWTTIFHRLVTNFEFDNSDLQTATQEALINGNLEIIKSMLSVFGSDRLNFSVLPDKVYNDIQNKEIVNFLLKTFDPWDLNIAIMMTNACKFGWKDTASLIIDIDSSHNDFTWGRKEIASCSINNGLNCRCDFTLAFNTACENGENEIVKLLIEKVYHQIVDVNKAMLSVSIKGWDDIVDLLLENFDYMRLDIKNAFIEACRHGEIDVVQVILRKIKHNLLDVETALNKACESHMHEDLIVWILENINQEQVDLKTVRRKAMRHKWRKIQFATTEIEIEDQNQANDVTEIDCIVLS